MEMESLLRGVSSLLSAALAVEDFLLLLPALLVLSFRLALTVAYCGAVSVFVVVRVGV